MTDQSNKSIEKSNQKRDLRAMIEGDRFRNAVATALPRHLTPDRFIRIAIMALTRTPALAACTQESVFKCLIDLSALGLEPDGRRAHLIPYGTECTLIVDYKGIVELVRRSGDIRAIHADVICERDEFDYAYGSEMYLRHKPAFGERGPVVGAYSFVKLKDGTDDFTVMGVSEIEQIRKRSKAANKGPWVTDYNEMAKKTAFRRHSKMLPFSPELREAVEIDSEITPEPSAADMIAARPSFLSAPPVEPAADDDQIPMDDQPAEDPPHNPPPHTAKEPVALKEIRRLCKRDKVDQLAVLKQAQKTLGVDDSLMSLEEVAMVNENALKAIVERWDLVKQEIGKEAA